MVIGNTFGNEDEHARAVEREREDLAANLTN